MNNVGRIEIRVHDRILRIGNEVYQLSNVARVSSWTTRPARSIAGEVFSRIWKFVVAAVVASIAGAAGGQASQLATFGLFVFALYLVATFIIAMRNRTLHVLLIESSGVVRGVLGSRDPQVIMDLVDLVIQAIQHPPSNEIVKTVYNVVSGDQINQSGLGSIGKMSPERG
jgi:membrane-anchored protein YejM (alkaline phosphatase superfamily)